MTLGKLGRLGRLAAVGLVMGIWAGTGVCGVPVAGMQDAAAKTDAGATVTMEYTNDKLLPPHWVMSFHEDGSGWFKADKGEPSAEDKMAMLVGEINRPIQLNPKFVADVFATARSRREFDFACESHLKVAFQGMKKLSYSGPDGQGSCEYNYSKDKQIEALGESLMAVANTMVYGAMFEKLLQHDRLGLDLAMENLISAQHSGTALEMEVIKEILEKLANDDQVLERVRKRAKLLLVQSQ